MCTNKSINLCFTWRRSNSNNYDTITGNNVSARSARRANATKNTTPRISRSGG